MFQILLWFFIFGAILFYVWVRVSPDEPARPILNEDGWPEQYPRNDDQSTLYQARRGKVK